MRVEIAGTNPPATTAGRVVHSTGGQLLGQTMLGLARAIYGPPDDPLVIVASANGEPETDQGFAVHLDPDHPERSVVVFRSELEDPPPGESS